MFEKRLNAARQVITNQQIDAYNRVALDFFEDTSGNRMFSNIAVLKSISEITKQTMHSLKDGLHVSAGTLSFVSFYFCFALLNYFQFKLLSRFFQFIVLYIVAIFL